MNDDTPPGFIKKTLLVAKDTKAMGATNNIDPVKMAIDYAAAHPGEDVVYANSFTWGQPTTPVAMVAITGNDDPVRTFQKWNNLGSDNRVVDAGDILKVRSNEIATQTAVNVR